MWIMAAKKVKTGKEAKDPETHAVDSSFFRALSAHLNLSGLPFPCRLQARKSLMEGAQRRYTVKNAGFNSRIKTKLPTSPRF